MGLQTTPKDYIDLDRKKSNYESKSLFVPASITKITYNEKEYSLNFEPYSELEWMN